MNVWQSIGISVGSSFIVLFIIGVLKWQWQWWIINVVLKITCRHIIDISGEWESKTQVTDDPTGDIWQETIKLKQFGWKVKGQITHNHIGENFKIQGNFEFAGIFREGILSCHFWNSDRHKKGIGSFLLNLEGDGDKFIGQHCYYDTGESKMDCIPYEWKRV